jgi:uncharacterized protein with HEPN domain
VKSDRVYLKHILESIAQIESYAAVGRDAFLSTPHWRDAIVRQLEIIGEACKRISAETRARQPQIPWRRISGLRDVLIHDYMGIDFVMVWGIVERNLPELKAAVTALIESQDAAGY